MELYFGGDPLLRLRATPLSAILQGQGSSALIVECSQDVHVLGSEIRVGSQRGLALQSQGSVLRLNAGDMDPEDGHFGGGLSVGWLNDVVIRHDSMLDRTRVTMGQQMVAGKSTLVVAGGIRAAHGLPSPVDPEPDVGLSFLDDGSSGVFMSGESHDDLPFRIRSLFPFRVFLGIAEQMVSVRERVLPVCVYVSE